MLAVHDFAEAFDRLLQFDVLAFQACELGGNKERLLKELLNLAGP